MIARRAYQISEARGFTPGLESEDWQRADSEIVSPFCGGWTVADDRIVVTTTASLYKECAIEICVEPRRLAIFGKQRTSSGHNMPAEGRYNTQEKEIVRILELPVEIDPVGATAKFDHCMLEISLPRVRSTRPIGADSRAA
jgi:HSP20 family molecular chaperone IbpA